MITIKIILINYFFNESMSNSDCALCWNAFVSLEFLEKNFLFLVSFDLEMEIRRKSKLLEF